MAEKDHRKGEKAVSMGERSQYSSNVVAASIPRYLLPTISSRNKQRTSVSSLSANIVDKDCKASNHQKKSENVSSKKSKDVSAENDTWGVARPTCSSSSKHVLKAGNKILHAYPRCQHSHCSVRPLEDEAVPTIRESLAPKRLLKEQGSSKRIVRSPVSRMKNNSEDRCAVQETEFSTWQENENRVDRIPAEIYMRRSGGKGEFSCYNPSVGDLIQENVGSSDLREFKNTGDGDHGIKIHEGRFESAQKLDNVSAFQYQTVTFKAEGTAEHADLEKADIMADGNHEIKFGNDNFTSNAILGLQREQCEVAIVCDASCETQDAFVSDFSTLQIQQTSNCYQDKVKAWNEGKHEGNIGGERWEMLEKLDAQLQPIEMVNVYNGRFDEQETEIEDDEAVIIAKVDEDYEIGIDFDIVCFVQDAVVANASVSDVGTGTKSEGLKCKNSGHHKILEEGVLESVNLALASCDTLEDDMFTSQASGDDKVQIAAGFSQDIPIDCKDLQCLLNSTDQPCQGTRNEGKRGTDQLLNNSVIHASRGPKENVIPSEGLEEETHESAGSAADETDEEVAVQDKSTEQGLADSGLSKNTERAGILGAIKGRGSAIPRKLWRPRKVQPLVEESHEREGVLLRHHSIPERKASHEWSIDYALTQTVAKLTPFQRRKVDLLREAYESVIRLNKSENHQFYFK